MPTPSPTQSRTRAAWAWGSSTPPPSRPPLTIRRSPTGYVVEDPALTRLAGLGPLPLPFTPEATPDEVLAHLRRLNPHREVRLDSSSPFPNPSSPASGASAIPHPSCG